MSVDGVLARSVADTALFHDVASGSIDSDVDRPEPPPVPFAQAAATPPGRLRIAWSTKFPGVVLAKLDEREQGGAARDRRAAAARSATRRASSDPDYGNDAVPRRDHALHARWPRRRLDAVRTPSAWNGARARSRASGA